MVRKGELFLICFTLPSSFLLKLKVWKCVICVERIISSKNDNDWNITIYHAKKNSGYNQWN
jgi:hypothetical protein